MKKFLMFFSIFATLSLAMGMNGAGAATLVFEDGQLTGANGITVNGVLYDVSFEDGSANNIYDYDDLTFNTVDEATLASTALLDQVFNSDLDGDYASVDNNYSLTFGIDNNFFGVGWIETVYAFTPGNEDDPDVVSTTTTINGNLDSEDYVESLSNINAGENFSSGIFGDIEVYALWNEAAPVPVPGAVWLLGSGLIAIFGIRRRVNR